MASRCFTDPLDPADDVCDMCFGNYCLKHLVHAKGRKNPICIECALRLSGVRSGGPIPPVDDPKTAARRRDALKSEPQKERPVFLYFDDPDADLVKEPETYESIPVETPASGASRPSPTALPTDVETLDSTTNAPSTDAAFEGPDLPIRPPTDSPDDNEQPVGERLPPVITRKSTILDQIVEDKQNRAQQLAQEMENRLESTP